MRKFRVDFPVSSVSGWQAPGAFDWQLARLQAPFGPFSVQAWRELSQFDGGKVPGGSAPPSGSVHGGAMPVPPPPPLLLLLEQALNVQLAATSAPSEPKAPNVPKERTRYRPPIFMKSLPAV
jgi:hypothetical protein